MTINVLFVCLGNICRSSAAQGVFQRYVDDAGLSRHISIDSCGTAAFNVGKPPDSRAIDAALRHGYDIREQVARQIHPDDYQQFEFILPMDRKNMSSVTAWAPDDYQGEIELFMKYGKHSGISQLSDPYYEKAEKFDGVIKMIEKASHGLLNHIVNKHALECV